ncbi:MAG: phosphoribosylanthranilate isomerase [Oscillospiraceae bacterium]|nr:phosphoribosylanthranilate isomerase [Oscillospiraceae bacterium]
MTKIKMCGLTRPCDIAAANMLKPDYIGFVFAPKSKRYLTPEKAKELKALLVPDIRVVGVFVNEEPETVAGLLEQGIIDMVQLHGVEDEKYIACLRQSTSMPIIKAFQVRTSEDVIKAEASSADEILLDSGAGTGTVFNWELIRPVMRPYFLAGGLTPDNVGEAVRQLHPYAVDVSSGIERDGYKDQGLMAAFIAAVRKEDEV